MPATRTASRLTGARRALATAIAMIATALPGTVFGVHDPAEELEACTGAGYEGAFVCGVVLVWLEPTGTDIDAVVDACDPAPTVISGPVVSDSPETLGQRGYDLHVPTGAEIALRDCYLARPGVADAQLGGLGELTPNTALPARVARPPTAGELLLLASLASTLLVCRRREVERPARP